MSVCDVAVAVSSGRSYIPIALHLEREAWVSVPACDSGDADAGRVVGWCLVAASPLYPTYTQRTVTSPDTDLVHLLVTFFFELHLHSPTNHIGINYS